MSTYRQTGFGFRVRGPARAAIAAVGLVALGGPTYAQGFFESFFQRINPSVPAYSNPNADFNPYGARPEPRHEMGGSVSFCVRTCDGRHFPIQRTAGSNPAQLCSASCPASQTTLYHGSSIDHAVAPDGKPYSELSTAFVYREKIVPGCTCNGRDAFGLVTTPVQHDPTLRPGDIVATRNGLMAYAGTGGRNQTAQFTPIESQQGLSAELRQKLSETKVDPTSAPPAPVLAKPSAESASPVRNARNKRVQVDR